MTPEVHPARIRLAILGAIGKGPCDLTDLRWALNKAGVPFLETTTVLNAILPIMQAEKRIEQGGSGNGMYWRLRRGTPLDASAPRTGAGTGTVKDGFISASDFKKSGTRGRK